MLIVRPLNSYSDISFVKADGAVGSSNGATVNIDTTGVEAGDLYVVAISCDGSRDISISSGAGWRRVKSWSTDPSFAVFVGYYGQASTSLSVIFGASEAYAYQWLVLRGATQNIDLITTSETTVGTTSNHPDLPETYAHMESMPYTWIQIIATQGKTISSFNDSSWTGYTMANGTASTNAGLGVGFKSEDTDSLDPPAATLSSTGQIWAGSMIIIPPEGADGVVDTGRMEKNVSASTSSTTMTKASSFKVVPGKHGITVQDDEIIISKAGTVRVQAGLGTTNTAAHAPIIHVYKNGSSVASIDTYVVNAAGNTFIETPPKYISVDAGDRISYYWGRTSSSSNAVEMEPGSETYLEVEFDPEPEEIPSSFEGAGMTTSTSQAVSDARDLTNMSPHPTYPDSEFLGGHILRLSGNGYAKIISTNTVSNTSYTQMRAMHFDGSSWVARTEHAASERSKTSIPFPVNHGDLIKLTGLTSFSTYNITSASVVVEPMNIIYSATTTANQTAPGTTYNQLVNLSPGSGTTLSSNGIVAEQNISSARIEFLTSAYASFAGVTLSIQIRKNGTSIYTYTSPSLPFSAYTPLSRSYDTSLSNGDVITLWIGGTSNSNYVTLQAGGFLSISEL